MKRRLVPFFATLSDLRTVLNDVCELMSLDFVRRGMFDTSGICRMQYPFDLAQHDCYLIITEGTNITANEVPQRQGGIKYAIDQSQNPDSIDFITGGSYNPTILLPGQIGTISSSCESLKLFGIFETTIRKHFNKVKAYCLGAEALEMLDKGCRLTASVKGASIYDLRRS